MTWDRGRPPASRLRTCPFLALKSHVGTIFGPLSPSWSISGAISRQAALQHALIREVFVGVADAAGISTLTRRAAVAMAYACRRVENAAATHALLTRCQFRVAAVRID